MIAHDGKIRAARHAHAHDGGDLRNTHRAHHRVVAKDAAKIIGVRKNIFLERQKHSRGIDQIDRWNVIFDGDILRADHFLRGHGEKRAGFYGRIIRDDHKRAAAHFCEPGDGSCGWRAAPFLVHFERGVDSQFEEMRAGVDQLL